jgi:hypothetical protein
MNATFPNSRFQELNYRWITVECNTRGFFTGLLAGFSDQEVLETSKVEQASLPVT